MRTKPPVLDLSQEHTLSTTAPRPSLLSSHSAQWQHIYLEFHRLPPFEVPEYTYQQHLITIPTVTGINVEQKIGRKRHNLVFYPDTVTIAPQSLCRQYRWEQELTAIQLSIEPDFLSHAAPELIAPERVELISQSIVRDPLLYHLGLALKLELMRSHTDSKLYADSAAPLLAIHLLRRYTNRKPKQNTHTKGLSPRQLRLAIAYIQAHLNEEICLDAIADELGFSRYYFCRLFKQSTGFSPYQYVIRCRIERAKQLLKKGDESIAEIALTCGFSHQSHLHRHFKRLTGVTPKKFINS
jgi:AraC family transcriptional regulator